MEFTVQKARFQDELGRLSSVVEKKSSIPILENAVIRGDTSKIKLQATDLDLTMFSECPVDTMSNPGEACVPARRLFDIVKLMPDGPIKVTADTNQWVVVKAKGSNFRIPGANPGQFPQLQTIPTDWTNIPGKALKLGLRGAGFAASANEDNRYALAGVKIEIGQADLTMVATDGRRLSLVTGPIGDLLFNTIDTILPAKAVSEVTKLISDYDGPIGIAVGTNGVFFRTGSRVLYSRLLTGKFPSYKPFTDVIYPYKAVFQADQLAQALRRAQQVLGEKEDGVLIAFKDNYVSFHAQNAEVGECYEVMTSNFNGGELKIVCSSKFLLDYLELMGSEKVDFEIKDAKTQVHLRCVIDNMTYRYYLVPMAPRE